MRRLCLAEGMSIEAIARRLGVARNTVRAALRSESAPNTSERHAARRSTCSRRRYVGCWRSRPTCRRRSLPSGSGGPAGSRCCVSEWPSCGRPTRCRKRSGALSTKRESCVNGTCGSRLTRSRSTTARQRCCRCSSGCRATSAGYSGR
ncbi:MAG: hypothetical protein ACRD0Z_04695 [Acidimicrobiales bacterium]